MSIHPFKIFTAAESIFKSIFFFVLIVKIYVLLMILNLTHIYSRKIKKNKPYAMVNNYLIVSMLFTVITVMYLYHFPVYQLSDILSIPISEFDCSLQW